MKKGLYIVLEGISGGGKGTQQLRIASDLYNRSKFEDVLLTREPSDTPSGRRVRAQREADKAAGIPTSQHADLYAQLYTEDTIVHCGQLIAPALQRGTHVVCDRNYHSRFAYQAREGVPVPRLLGLRNSAGIIIPDLTLILDLDPKLALARIDSDRSRSGRSSLEQEKIMNDLRERYRGLPGILGDENIKIVDASGTEEHTFSNIKPHLDELWGRKAA